MSRLLHAIALAVLLAGSAFAASPFQQAVTALGGLDPARVPTGRLYDRALPLSGLPLQDGSGAGPALGASAWRQMLHEMRLSSPTPPEAWPTPDQARDVER